MPTNHAEETSHTEVVMGTALEQLEGAALALARSAPIKERLADAYRSHLALVNPEELPAALRAEFRACQDALTRERPLRGEDAVRATVRKMSSQQADEVAGCVVRLFAAMARQAIAEAALATADVPDAALTNGSGGARVLRKSVPQVVPLFVTKA